MPDLADVTSNLTDATPVLDVIVNPQLALKYRWGGDFPVTQVKRSGVKVTLFYRDSDNEEKGINGRESAEYLAKKRQDQ